VGAAPSGAERKAGRGFAKSSFTEAENKSSDDQYYERNTACDKELPKNGTGDWTKKLR
jgi:hypothetical protein